MTPREQATWLENDILSVIHKAKTEFDLTAAEAIGVLECVKLSIFMEAHKIAESAAEDEEEED